MGGLDLNTLKIMYEREAAELERALLRGVSWDDLREQRKNVTELAIALHQKRFSSMHPAGSALRTDSRHPS